MPQAIARNRQYDGKFVYGVISTKIYCHPSCPARKPQRDKEELSSILYQEFHQAQLICDREINQDWVEKVIDFIDGNQLTLDLPLDVRGTAFQKQVWQALQKIPYGETCTYKDIANQINKPSSSRAVGKACGANPTALIVPCHRVVKNDGSLGGYRWGIERKRKLLNQESQDFEF